MTRRILAGALGALLLAAPAQAHVTPRKDKRAVRVFIRQAFNGRSIGLGFDVRDPLNHVSVLSGSFIRPNGRRCVITQATVRHGRLRTINTCLGGLIESDD